MIIFDVTDSFPEKLGKLLCGSRESNGGKTLNVAITRPKDVLLILGNLSYLRKNAHPNSQISKIIFEMINTGKIIEALDIFPEEAKKVFAGSESNARIKFENNKILDIFREDVKEKHVLSIFRNAKIHRILLLPRIKSLEEFSLNPLNVISEKSNVRTVLITNKIRNLYLKEAIAQKGIEIFDNPLDIDLNIFIGDTNILIPLIGR
ncbi:MAG: hypothetical protein N3B16_10230 [Candidatus Aminicenantes bacterium]|nr:hypothetical protein [Candidatus Aminicenantes bacterium]